MKISWYRKKLTFLVIQDANRSVIQFNLLKPVVIIIPIIVAIISLALVALYFFHKDSVENHQLLFSEISEQLALTEQSYEQSVASSNQTIESLQNDIIALSQQAESIQAKVKALKELENEIRDVTEPIANHDGEVTISSFDETMLSLRLSDPFEAVGGVHIPVHNEDISELAVSTESEFYHLDSELDLLLGSLALAKEQIVEYQELMRVTPTIWPTISQHVTSEFGYRTDPFTKRPGFHSGIDIGADRHDPVFATADGTVDRTGWDRSLGNFVVIKHDHGIRTFYLHLQKILVKSGQDVVKGEDIATIGSTGRSTGPHLHYEVEKNGAKVDPNPYMQVQRKD